MHSTCLPEIRTRPTDRDIIMRPVVHISSLMSASNLQTQPSTRELAVDGCGGDGGCCGRKTLNWYSWRPCRPIAMSPPGKADGRPADGERRRAVARHVTPTPTSPVGAERLRGPRTVGCWRGRRSRRRARGDRVAVGAGTARHMLGGA